MTGHARFHTQVRPPACFRPPVRVLGKYGPGGGAKGPIPVIPKVSVAVNLGQFNRLAGKADN